MNTVDALTQRGGHCANFLDTGGKATRETVKVSFRVILKDSRVKTIFVNIFGGLTLCDMIAEGVVLAYRGLGIGLPVVVRLRGTNEREGQRMVCWPSSRLGLGSTDKAWIVADRDFRLPRAGYRCMRSTTSKRLLRGLSSWQGSLDPWYI